jgi:serine/threonine protein kinase
LDFCLHVLIKTMKVNVLVKESTPALLCDFGLSCIIENITSRASTTSNNPPVPGSCNWMAPELLSGSLSRPSSGIYAFSVMLDEVRIVPRQIWFGFNSHKFIQAVCRRNLGTSRVPADEWQSMGVGGAVQE